MNQNIIARATKAKAEREGKTFEHIDASTMQTAESIKSRKDSNALNHGMQVSISSRCSGHAKEAVKVHYGINYDGEMCFPSFLDYEDMQNCTSSDFFKLRNADLEKICIELSVKRSGKKSEKVHSIMSGISDILQNVTWLTNIDLSGRDALDYILSNGLHEVIAYNIVRHHAFSMARYIIDPITGVNTGIGFPFTDAEGCKILMKNPNDPYWDDVKQEIASALLTTDDDIVVVNGYPKLTAKQWSLCARAISRFFYHTRTQYAGDKQKEENNVILSTCIVDDETDELIDIVDKVVYEHEKNNTAYIQALSANIADFDTLAHNDFLISFFRWLYNEKKYKKYYDSIFHYFTGKVEGMTNGEIMKKYRISRRIFDKSAMLIKEAYNDFGKYVCHVSERMTDGCTYYNSDNSASGSYTFSYGDAITRKSFSDIVASHPIPSGERIVIYNRDNKQALYEQLFKQIDERDAEIKEAESRVQKASAKLEYRKESGFLIVSRNGEDIERYRIVKAV